MSTYLVQAPPLSTEDRAALQSRLGDAILNTSDDRAQRWARILLDLGALGLLDPLAPSFSVIEIIAAACREPLIAEVIANVLQFYEYERRRAIDLVVAEQCDCTYCVEHSIKVRR